MLLHGPGNRETGTVGSEWTLRVPVSGKAADLFARDRLPLPAGFDLRTSD